MAELIPAPFADLVTRLYEEPGLQDTLFDLPRRSWYLPEDDEPDMTVRFHGGMAGNPCGPASGPHTQMAQNLVLSYIAGGRIMELKTVQILDRLEIPRPCIDMANVGYNVEWSQELRVEESLREYVAGMMLVEMLRRTHPAFAGKCDGPSGEVIYDISLGYDLKGIKSDKIQRYLDAMDDATGLIEALRAEVPKRYAAARDLEYPGRISGSVTLSTFHGCPTDEIERICEFLIAERGLDTIVKMNPPTLGKDRLEGVLNDTLGYRDIRVAPNAYKASQSFEEAVATCRRLTEFARKHGRRFGCKFSNTLEVVNHRDFFTKDNEVMYLSGAPLHVITLTLTDLFRREVGPEVPISFSAGIDAQNFSHAAACGFVPITVCSDLLKTGGYGRLPAYLRNLSKAMKDAGAENMQEYIALYSGGQVPHAEAMLRNTSLAAENARKDARYHASNHEKPPKRIDSHLVLFDCLTCDKCIPVCPNDANFTLPIPKVRLEYRNIRFSGGSYAEEEEAQVFELAKKHQIANYQEFCNECGNCDTFCPEYGGPYIEKPGFFRTLASFEAVAPRDGFVVGMDHGRGWICGRIKAHVYTLEHDRARGIYRFDDGVAEAEFDAETFALKGARTKTESGAPHTIDVGLFHSLRVLREGILDTSRLNQVNAASWAGDAS